MIYFFKIWGKQKTLLMIFVFSFLPLLFVYIAQYAFEMTPCNLCLWQRKPLIIIFFLSTLALTRRKGKKLTISISIVLVIVNIFISFYHVGVENKIFSVPKSCETINFSTDNVKKLEELITNTPATRCDKPVYIFGKISMALANFIYSICFLILLLVSLYSKRFKCSKRFFE
jgi:disulfide bond formation protein DsbB